MSIENREIYTKRAPYRYRFGKNYIYIKSFLRGGWGCDGVGGVYKAIYNLQLLRIS